ncbi:MAG: hypothetical protein H0W12_10095 [Chitinophagaceae bacterium]|nr:hypothetical protein [Chitinophagaceae bacterium]
MKDDTLIFYGFEKVDMADGNGMEMEGLLRRDRGQKKHNKIWVEHYFPKTK